MVVNLLQVVEAFPAVVYSLLETLVLTVAEPPTQLCVTLSVNGTSTFSDIECSQ